MNNKTEIDRQNALMVYSLIVAIFFLGVFMSCLSSWWSARCRVNERAAYLEGRYDLDHETALAYAREGY